MGLHQVIELPDVPAEREEVLDHLATVGGVLVEHLGEGWVAKPTAMGDVLTLSIGRAVDARIERVSIRGTWDDGPPSQWVLEAEAGPMPVVSTADKVVGAVAVAMCVLLGLGAAGAVIWALSNHWFIAGSVAIPVGLGVTVTSLFASLYVTPRSPVEPLPEEAVEGFVGRVREAVSEAEAAGVLVRSD